MRSGLSIVKGIILVIGFSSCEKVIDLNLNDVEKRYVIEGIITDQPGTCRVKITQTKDMDENNQFPGITGAIVTVSDNNGPAVPLLETSAGLYETEALNGTVGHTYTLAVNINGQLFNASSTMPSKINMDSLYVEELLLFDGTKLVSSVEYVDPSGKGNSYRFVEFRNGIQESTIFVNNDDYTDDRKVTTQLISFGDDEEEEDEIKTGDTLTVEMHCIDNAIYKYWFSLEAASGESDDATPANPVTNMRGGALGYFSAHTRQVKSIIVQ